MDTLKKLDIYKNTLNKTNDEKYTIAHVIDILNSKNLSIDDVDNFIDNYEDMTFTHDNIELYCNLAFCSTTCGIEEIKEDFSKFLVRCYFNDLHFFKIIIKYEPVIQHLCRKFSDKYNNYSDADLTHIIICSNCNIIKSINTMDARFTIFTDAGIRYYTNLTSLNISNHKKITNDSVKHFINLTELYADENPKISDASVILLTKLKILHIKHNNMVTNKSIQCLTQLTDLDISHTAKISDKFIKNLNLTKLSASRMTKETISNESIKCFINLTYLDICNNLLVSDESISCLKNLTYLDMSKTKKITNDGIKKLSKLTNLNVSSTCITDIGIKNLVNLTTLNVSHCIVTNDGIKYLVKLTKLNDYCTLIKN